jgi:hypothetical protein
MEKSNQQKLIDYFVICGLNIPSGLESDQLAGDNLHCSPLDRPYKSNILAHYPDTVASYPFDSEAVCMLCFPRGLNFCTQNGLRKSSFHSFVITKEDGTRAYGAALRFFEEIEDIQICLAMQTLQAMHMAELSNAQSRTLYLHLGPVYSRSPKSEKKSDMISVGQVYDQKKDTLFCTKCICFISRLPLIWTYSKLLQSLHDLVMADEQLDSLPCYIYNMIHELPLFAPGRSMRITTYKGSIISQRPGNNELPLLDYPLREVFDLLNVHGVLTIFCSILLEHQILFL